MNHSWMVSVLVDISLCFLVFVCAGVDNSGTCGNNLQWSYDNNTKQLTISGSGEMNCETPWAAFKQLIESVAFQGSVTSIGDNAFLNCFSLSSIEIPSTITEIGHRAFENCVSLTSVTIPQSVISIASEPFVGCTSLSVIHVDSSNSIYEDIEGVLFLKFDHTLLIYPAAKRGDYNIPENTEIISTFAFSDCVYLTSVTIPDTVTTIYGKAFSNCTSLTNVSIPASVSSFQLSPFMNCSNLTFIEVDSNNKYYKSVDGVLFNKEGTILIQYPGGMKGHYTIPADVTSINHAFIGCAGLTSVTIPSSITAMDYCTFQFCSNLEYVSYLGTSNPGTDVVFFGCDKLSAISVPLDYESTEFCGKSSIYKTETHDNPNNCCFYAECENGEIVLKMRDNATEWEKQSNQCYEYRCVNGSGPESWKRDNVIEWEKRSDECVEHLCSNKTGIAEIFICTTTDTLNRTCVNGKCYDGEPNMSWSFEMEMGGVPLSALNMTDLSDFFDLTNYACRVTVDEYGNVLAITVFMDDDETAKSSLVKMKKCQRAKDNT